MTLYWNPCTGAVVVQQTASTGRIRLYGVKK